MIRFDGRVLTVGLYLLVGGLASVFARSSLPLVGCVLALVIDGWGKNAVRAGQTPGGDQPDRRAQKPIAYQRPRHGRHKGRDRRQNDRES